MDPAGPRSFWLVVLLASLGHLLWVQKQKLPGSTQQASSWAKVLRVPLPWLPASLRSRRGCMSSLTLVRKIARF